MWVSVGSRREREMEGDGGREGDGKRGRWRERVMK